VTRGTGQERHRWRLIVLDFDGTLADTYPWFRAVLSPVAQRWGFREVAEGEHAALRRLDASAVFRHLGVPRWKLPLIAADLRRRMAADIDRIQLFDGVGPMVHSLCSSGLEVAIASSNAAANVERVLGPELCRLLPQRECGAALSGKAVRLRRLLERGAVSPAQAIYIGDEVRDIVAARRAGMAAGAVAWGYNDLGTLLRHEPDLVFEQVADIACCLLDPDG